MTVGIEISSMVRSKLNSLSIPISDFKLELSETLSGSNSHLFGRNVRNNNSSDVWHIHFIPLTNSDKLEEWNINYRKNYSSSYNRTSDNLIFYTMNRNNTCLVIEFMTPNGHKSFNNRQFLHNLEIIADSFINRGIIP